MADEKTLKVLQLLTFKLDEEIFALEIDRIREVLEFREPIKVPSVPGFVRGVINHRGEMVPVVDLKTRIGLKRTVRNLHTCIIISEAELDGLRIPFGTMADAPTEVVDLDGECSAAKSVRQGKQEPGPIKAMCTHCGRSLKLINADGIFTPEEILAVAGSALQPLPS